MAWLLDIALKKLSNPSAMTIHGLEASISSWSAEDRTAGFLLLAKYVAVDLIQRADEDNAQLALKCLKAAAQGKQLPCPELIKLASALDIGTEELKKILESLRTKSDTH